MDKFQNKFLEIKNINKDYIDWLEDIAEENNCRIERKEWKSKYNSYVVYDYEPFCSEGFEINILFSSLDISYLNFIKYLYNEKLSTIEYLENCLLSLSARLKVFLPALPNLLQCRDDSRICGKAANLPFRCLQPEYG